MTPRNYWLDLFSLKTWQEFLDGGGSVSGFRESRWSVVQQISIGDYLLCYLTGVSRWVGVLEVISEPFWEETPIWDDLIFPCRVGVTTVELLTPETAVPVFDLREQLSAFKNLKNPNAWTGRFRGSPTKWSEPDGNAVVRAVRAAKAHPIQRPLPRRSTRLPRAVTVQGESFTVPAPSAEGNLVAESSRSETVHDEIQWLLLKLGNEIGLDVWVARNDRSREVDGNRFSELPRLRKTLPRQFDEVTNRTIEHIDVLWLQGNAIIAAFEIESTTSIYSGLLRMSDLVAMQPNLNIPLFLVAPDERRGKVIAEVNRPTFTRLVPPLRDVCRFIAFSTLRDHVPKLLELGPYLRPEVLDRLSEECVVDDL